MKPPTDNSFTSPQVVAVSAAVASAVAGLGIGLARRRMKPTPPPTRLPHSLDDPRVRSAVRAAQETLEGARGRVELRDGDMIRHAMERRVRPAVAAARADFSPKTQEVAERAREAAEKLRDEGMVRSTHLAERIRADVAPAARSWTREALAEAEDILTAARERATEVSSTARTTYAPTARTKTTTAAAAASGVLAGVGQAVGARLSEIGERRRTLTARGLPRPRRMPTRAVSRRAAAQTKHVLGETTMIAVWAGLLGTVVYYGILTAEQRARVKGFVTRTFTQMRELGGDFQGEEPQSPPPLG